MPVVDSLLVEFAADLTPLRQAFGEAEQMAGSAASDLATALGGEGSDSGVFDLLARGVQSAGQTIRSTLVAAISGTEIEWDQVLSRMALKLSDLVLNDTLNNALAALSGAGETGGGSTASGLGNLLGSLFGGFRAGGGPVSPDRAYVVGENGPELFVPDGAGAVQAGAATGDATPRITVNISTPDIASFRQSQGQVAAAMVRALGAARRYS
ncbi:hypothetical protein [Zavarzinia sp.]|uniref:hypothetical protein n=1 Tax=Zavarzinia sp. TaxID=2027920 RepID=UPI00356AAA3F